MAATIIDGKKLAERMRADIRRQAAALAAEGHRPRLAAVMVGEPPAGMLYARSQARECADIGIDYALVQVPAECGPGCLCERIDQLNRDDGVTGPSGSSTTGCTIVTTQGGLDGRRYNGMWLSIVVSIPDSYSCTSDCFWQVRYNVSGNPTDRTTWKVNVVGNPVRLVPNGS